MSSYAATITVRNESGSALALVMVSRSLVEKPALDLSDDGYKPCRRKPQ